MTEQTPIAEVPVTLVIARRVRPGGEGRFEEWLGGIADQMRRFAGFRGLRLLPPVADVQAEHVVLVQFDSRAHLQQWCVSDVRRAWVEKTAAFTEQLVVVQPVSGLDGLFQLPHTGLALAPTKYKSVVVVTLGLYPLLVVSNLWVTPHLEWLSPLPRLLATTLVNVTLMAYVMMPLLTRPLRSWLAPRAAC